MSDAPEPFDCNAEVVNWKAIALELGRLYAEHCNILLGGYAAKTVEAHIQDVVAEMRVKGLL